MKSEKLIVFQAGVPSCAPVGAQAQAERRSQKYEILAQHDASLFAFCKFVDRYGTIYKL